jgi:hypothetical protein
LAGAEVELKVLWYTSSAGASFKGIDRSFQSELSRRRTWSL